MLDGAHGGQFSPGSLVKGKSRSSCSREGGRVGGQIDWSRHQRNITIEGRRVRYVEIGSGPLGFVLVHGVGGCLAPLGSDSAFPRPPRPRYRTSTFPASATHKDRKEAFR